MLKHTKHKMIKIHQIYIEYDQNALLCKYHKFRSNGKANSYGIEDVNGIEVAAEASIEDQINNDPRWIFKPV